MGNATSGAEAGMVAVRAHLDSIEDRLVDLHFRVAEREEYLQEQATIAAGRVAPPPSRHYLNLCGAHLTCRREVRIAVGPVVGAVGPTSAIVLLEVNVASEVTAYACTSDELNPLGFVVAKDTLTLDAGRPAAFHFNDLIPGCQYTVYFSGISRVDAQLRVAKFKTIAPAAPTTKVAVVANNHPATTFGIHTASMWERLADSVANDKVDVVLHIGGQVDMTPIVREAWMFLRQHEATGFLRQSLEEQVEADVSDKFREAYRKAWNQPHIRQVLATTSNLMMWNDADICANFSCVGGLFAVETSRPDADQHVVPAARSSEASLRRVLRLAHAVFREYQRQLYDLEYDTLRDAVSSPAVDQHARLQQEWAAAVTAAEAGAAKAAALREGALQMADKIDKARAAVADTPGVAEIMRQTIAELSTRQQALSADADAAAKEAERLSELVLVASTELNEFNQVTGEQHWHTIAHDTAVIFVDLKGSRINPDGAPAWGKSAIQPRQWRLISSALDAPHVKNVLVVADCPFVHADAHSTAVLPRRDLNLTVSPAVDGIVAPADVLLSGHRDMDREYAVTQAQRKRDAAELLQVAKLVATWKANGEGQRQAVLIGGGVGCPLQSLLQCDVRLNAPATLLPQLVVGNIAGFVRQFDDEIRGKMPWSPTENPGSCVSFVHQTGPAAVSFSMIEIHRAVAAAPSAQSAAMMVGWDLTPSLAGDVFLHTKRPAKLPNDASCLLVCQSSSEVPRGGVAHVLVGPIIGKVTHCSANVLLEVAGDGNVTCTLTDEVTQQQLTVSKELLARRPAAFSFQGLTPQHRYRIAFSNVVRPEFHEGYITTFPAPPHRLGMFALNGSWSPLGPSSIGTWRELARVVCTPFAGPDVVVHLGNQVDLLSAMPAAATHAVAAQLATETSVNTMDAKQRGKIFNAMVECFQQVYRAHWTTPVIRDVLANVSNLMAPGPMDLGAIPWDAFPPGCPRKLLTDAMHEVYRMYQRQLWDPEPVSLTAHPAYGGVHGMPLAVSCGESGKEWHYHRWGSVGVFITDSQTNVVRDGTSASPLSADQVAELERILQDTQLESLCIVLSAPVIVHTPSQAAVLADDPVYNAETGALVGWTRWPQAKNALLQLLYKFTTSTPNRQVILLCAAAGLACSVSTVLRTTIAQTSSSTVGVVRQLAVGPTFEAGRQAPVLEGGRILLDANGADAFTLAAAQDAAQLASAVALAHAGPASAPERWGAVAPGAGYMFHHKMTYQRAAIGMVKLLTQATARPVDRFTDDEPSDEVLAESGITRGLNSPDAWAPDVLSHAYLIRADGEFLPAAEEALLAVPEWQTTLYTKNMNSKAVQAAVSQLVSGLKPALLTAAVELAAQEFKLSVEAVPFNRGVEVVEYACTEGVLKKVRLTNLVRPGQTVLRKVVQDRIQSTAQGRSTVFNRAGLIEMTRNALMHAATWAFVTTHPEPSQ